MPYTWPVSLDDVHSQLGIPAGDTSNDTELQGFIDAATDYVAYLTGPIVSTVYTDEIHDGGWPTIVLFNPPVLSVESVTEYIGITAHTLTAQPPGSTTDSYGYSLDDPASGILVRRSGAGTPIPFMGGDRSVVVSYTAGRASVPADVRLAALLDIQGLWEQTQRGSSTGRPMPGGEGFSPEAWGGPPMTPFPRLGALLTGPSRTPSIA